MKLSFWDIMASMVMLAGLALATIFINIFINPYSFINPFPPPTPIATLDVPTMTPSQRSLPELWTLTPTLFGATDAIGTPTITATGSTATGTVTGTVLVLPTSTATPTKSITPTITKTITRTPNRTLTSYYVKTAVKTATKTSTSSDTTPPTNPGTPTTTSTTSDSTPNWTWTASTDSGSGLSLYQITWGYSNDCDNTVYTSTTNSWVAPVMPANTTLYICVRAKDKEGNESSWIGPSGFTYSAVGSPTVTTNPATSIAITTVTLNGIINANANDTSVYFEYGATTAYGVTLIGSPATVTGSTATAVTYNLTGLAAHATYHYRVYGINSIARVNGADSTFTTLATSSTTTIGVIAPEPSVVGQSYSVPVTVTGSGGTPTGTVAVNDGSVSCTITLSAGTGSCNLISSTVGAPKTITAIYSGSASFATSNTTATHTVNKATPTVSVWPTASAITFGQALSSSTLTGGTASVAGTFAFITPATAPAVGTAAQGVRFTPTNSAGYNTVDGTVNVTVNKATPVITFGAAPTPTYSAGGTFTVSATTTNTDSGTLTYSLSSGTACTYSGAGGIFNMVSAGTCVVQATGAATANFNTATNTQTVTIVNPATPVITFGAAPTPSYSVGGTFTVSATTTNTDSSTLTYSVSSGTACTYSGAGGVFDIVSAGPCVVQADGAATAHFTTATQTQSVSIVKANPTIAFGGAGSPVYGNPSFTDTATTTNSDSNTLTYSVVSGPCATGGSDTFTISGAGTCVVRADGVATTNYNAANNSQSVTIAKAGQTISFTGPGTGTTPGSASLTATSDSGLTVSFSSTTTGVCTVSGTTVTYLAAGTCTIQADQAGNVNYNAATPVSDNITVS